jgi:hypothetical protein
VNSESICVKELSKTTKSLVKITVSGPRFEHGTSHVRSSSANHSMATFGVEFEGLKCSCTAGISTLAHNVYCKIYIIQTQFYVRLL